ncbi:MAG: LysR family transcriptional regulator [Hyphomicrobiaceae bacterium]
MEMHQIRYFIATTRTLNFTRAAEECNIAQPSLTRGIKLLEDELGGELFRRERNLTHLTDLGQRMLPLLQQCYESALNAKLLAKLMKGGTVAPLPIALSRTIGMNLLIPHLSELIAAFSGLELKFVRGTTNEVGEALKKGEAALAVAGSLGSEWERLDAWPLFTEACGLLVARDHPLTARNALELEHLKGERLLQRAYCEQADTVSQLLQAAGLPIQSGHVVANEADLEAMLAAKVGVAIGPRSAAMAAPLRFMPVSGISFERTVYAYAVAGRTRSPVAATLLKLLRAADWPRITGSAA